MEETSAKLTEHKSNVTGIGRIDALAAINAVEASDGMNENKIEANIYPNPTTDIVTIQCDGMTQVKVFSMDGKLVRNWVVNNNVCQINNLEDGIYLIKIETVKGVLMQKIVKRR